MVSVKELRSAIAEVNAKGRAVLQAVFGIALDPTATTNDIMDSLKKIPPLQYAKTIEGLYYKAVLPENTELVLNGSELYNLSDTFRECKNLIKVKVLGNVFLAPAILDNTFNLCSNLTEVDFTEFALTVNSMASPFNMCKSLVRVLGEFDLTDCVTATIGFTQLTSLEEIRFKSETIKSNITMAQSSALSSASVDSIIEGLMPLTEPKNLKFNTAVVSRLTPQQRETVYSKGWTLVE